MSNSIRSNSIRPLALTAEQTRLLQHGAESCFKHALTEVTRGRDPGDAAAIRHELALAMYRFAMRELGEAAPDDDWWGETDVGVPLFAEGTPPLGSPRPARTIELWTCKHGTGDRPCGVCFDARDHL